MNPIELSQNLQTGLKSYLSTIFDVNRDGNNPELAEAIQASFDFDGALSKGPYLEITPPYKRGASMANLIEEGLLSPRFKTLDAENLPLPIDSPLYAHQTKAIRRLIEHKSNVVVSSGTGSGKTESFLIPIMNDLLQDDSPGVRALLIYPLNALVNDQLDRLRKLLKGTGITFGRYTSELDEYTAEGRKKNPDALENEVISREQIRNGELLPQILITNYAMLEYLLLRPDDSILFTTGKWRFIVLDEAHTYSGAQGIEVSMLLRRLKHRLEKKPGEVQCIATSATLTSDDESQAVQFAENLFAEKFSTEDIILGETDRAFINEQEPDVVDEKAYLHEDFPKLIATVREGSPDVEAIGLYMQEIGFFTESSDWEALVEEAEGEAHAFLYKVLLRNPHLTKLRQWMLDNQDLPIPLEDAATMLFSDALDSRERLQALYHLVELGALARENLDTAPLLPARYHQFMRSPQGIWLCLNPDCVGRDSSLPKDLGWSKVFATRRETCDSCGCKVYPVKVCRECGQFYIFTHYENGKYFTEPNVKNKLLLPDYEKRYLSLHEIHADLSLGENSQATDEEETVVSTNQYPNEDLKLCLQCGKMMNGDICLCAENGKKAVPVTVKLIFQTTAKGKSKEPLHEMNECPRCFSTAQKGTEIATEINLSGSGPLATLTYELYRKLPVNPKMAELAGGGRKLLTFYDSRQGAARFASYVQDVVNLENYQHIFPKAVQAVEKEKGLSPDFALLTEAAYEIARKEHVFHNDPDFSKEMLGSKRISPQLEDRLKTRIKKQLLGDISTGRKRRQSLESLGIVAVQYFDERQLPDFAKLAETLCLSAEQTRNLVEYLLDDLRYKKVLELPSGVEAKDEIFGDYTGHPKIVRGKADPYKHEQPWVATERQARSRYMKLVLEKNKLPHSHEDVTKALNAILDWLLEEQLLVGSAREGYRLPYSLLIFQSNAQWYRCQKCQRLHAHGNHLPCPHQHCGGSLEKLDVQAAQANNFFYQSLNREIVPIRVEEHTAQLSSEKGRQYQDDFRRGYVNLLSCSTTFEMGIDLGDLQAVVMSNVPPRVANYRQRAGRAGRRAGGAAFILTWAGERPHDQTYFANPPEIIRGHVRIPYIATDNHYIKERHTNAILLSEFLRHRKHEGAGEWQTIGAFFEKDHANNDPHYPHLAGWHESEERKLLELLERFEANLGETALKKFETEIQRIYENYLGLANAYQTARITLDKQVAEETDPKARKDLREKADDYDGHLGRLQKKKLIDYLSDNQVLPSYSFPIHSVQLDLPDEAGNELRLQRDLKTAIREYAPGSEIVADKRVWRSDGIRIRDEAAEWYEYRICETCNYPEISKENLSLPITEGGCPICGKSKSKAKRFIIPDGFFAGKNNNGKPARQYVHTEPSLMRSALLPVQTKDREQLNALVSVVYEREGELLYVNEGDRRGQGFHIHLTGDKRGQMIIDKKSQKEVNPLTLGHKRKTDTLHLHFHHHSQVSLPTADNASFWLSLMYALIQGASRALQIERADIDGVLYPRRAAEGDSWEQTIVLYDNVPGGAGHVRQIQKHLGLVIREALAVVNCVDCAPETSCYHCLRDYSNQEVHGILKRAEVLRFLESLAAAFDTTVYPYGAHQPIAINRPRWIMQQIENAKSSVKLAAQEISLEAPSGAPRSWLEVLQELLRRGVKVELRLRTIADSSAADLSLHNHLQLLIQHGMQLELVDNLADWQLVIDEGMADARAIQIPEDYQTLNKEFGANGLLLTTLQTDAIKELAQAWQKGKGKIITWDDLKAPEGVQVINFKPRDSRRNEKQLFQHVFSQSVKRLFINDPYLYSYEHIVERVGAYIALAQEAGKLEYVKVVTKRAGTYMNGTPQEQDKARLKLQQKFAGLEIDFSFKDPGHDRYIELVRENSKARILLGRGLDFIQSNGNNKETFIVIQDPYKG